MVVFSKVMPAVIRPPALTLEEVKKKLCEAFPELSAGPLSTHRFRNLDGVELFGQSMALREGYANHGLKMGSFDCRSFSLSQSCLKVLQVFVV